MKDCSEKKMKGKMNTITYLVFYPYSLFVSSHPFCEASITAPILQMRETEGQGK